MFQSFETTADGSAGAARLSALRAEMAAEGLAGFLVPRADIHQGEYVADCDARLAWLTGFTGSAGFCAALRDEAGVFVDGRYRTQVKGQVDLAQFTPVDWPEVQLAGWLNARLGEGDVLGLDPWLHTVREGHALEAAGITLRAVDNLVDRIWPDRPARPAEPAVAYPAELAGKGDETKRAEIAAALRAAGVRAAVLTQPDSICWLLNIRGSDITHNPIVQALAIVHDDGRVDLFSDPEKFEGLGDDADVTLLSWAAFEAALGTLSGPVGVDYGTAPLGVYRALSEAGAEARDMRDPCAIPKACKTPAEQAATREAHLRDGAAMVRFLAWLEANAPGDLTEIDVVRALEGFRRETNALRDISFDTIAGSGPHGAIMHYRVTQDTNRALAGDPLLLVDSGGQYLDGTTDITRTMALRDPSAEHIAAYTQVLQGVIAISRARFPVGVAGMHLDALARQHLWAAGRDFDHGTGHGVGVYLSVHEGPQRLARISDLSLQEGMMLSNEPGYYVPGHYGIRLENLIITQIAPPLPGGDDHREQLGFETVTFVPFDRRLIDAGALSRAERAWLDAYHGEVLDKIGPRVDGAASEWLEAACAPI